MSKRITGNAMTLRIFFKFLQKKKYMFYDRYILMNTHPRGKDVRKLVLRSQIFPIKLDGCWFDETIFMFPPIDMDGDEE
jgi:hypothetical protein